jgi:predicted nucleic acid-binding protein
VSGAEVAAYFFDSSALVKRYVQETGTVWIRRLVRSGKPDLIFLARITEVEMTSAVARRRRGGSLPAARVRSILTRFRSHLAGRYIAVEITPALLAAAARLANAHALRAYDAVQLAAALEVNGRYQSSGAGGITLISADQELNAAAAASGLVVDDPNAHP